MIELVFPVATVVFLYLIAVPLLTMLSAGMLRLWREKFDHAHQMGSDAVWLLLIAPVVVPTVWLLIALSHNFDGHHGFAGCIAPHDMTTFCIDLALAAFLVVVPFKLGAFDQWRRERGPARRDLRRDDVDGITVWRGKEVAGLACTRGLFRPRIEIDDRLFEHLAPEHLRTVLLHEQAHARAFDPLRKWVARVCLTINPLASLLRTDLTRWELGREVLSDLRAVKRGADRFALAEALVQVARHDPRPNPACCGILGMEALEIRVRILCDDHVPSPRFEVAPLIVGAVLGVLMMPHRGGHTFLEWLHHSAESSWLALFGG